MQQMLKALYWREFVSEFSSSLQIQFPPFKVYESFILLLFALMEFYSLREVRKQKKEKIHQERFWGSNRSFTPIFSLSSE